MSNRRQPAVSAKFRKRRLARELALQMLYALEFEGRSIDTAIAYGRDLAAEPATDDDDLKDQARMDEDGMAWATALARETYERLEALDQAITGVSTNWRVQRMAMVDRNILRLAACEILHRDDIPPKVTINEAIEIAKRYGTAESSAFINGLLDRLSGLGKGKPKSGTKAKAKGTDSA